MAAFHKNFVAIFIFISSIIQSLSIYLPTREETITQTTNLLIGKPHNENEGTLQQHIQLTYEWLQQKYLKSYVENDDVVPSGNDIVYELDDEVEDHNEEDLPSPQIRKRRELSDLFIAPNTRWCGRGNIANGTYNHLGGASSADKCCRKHDHCQLFIPAMSSRYELFNYRPYTLSHCNCDRRFRTCLKMANDEDANTIGKLFFNMVQTQCFVLRHEKLCQKRAENGSCEQEYLKQKAELRNNKKF